jgi:hypothetical protein
MKTNICLNGILPASEENIRIQLRSRILKSMVRSQGSGSGSVLRCHGSTPLVRRIGSKTFFRSVEVCFSLYTNSRDACRGRKSFICRDTSISKNGSNIRIVGTHDSNQKDASNNIGNVKNTSQSRDTISSMDTSNVRDASKGRKASISSLDTNNWRAGSSSRDASNRGMPTTAGLPA